MTAAAAGPLKILRLIARLNIGGPARHVVLLDHGLRERGHRTRLIHGSVGEGEGSLEHLANEFDVPVCKIADLGRRLSVFSDVRAFGRVLALFFREVPDVVHTHTAKAGALGRLAALLFNATRRRRRRCVVVHTFHGHVLEGYFGPVAERVVRVLERTLALVTDRIVAISPIQSRDLATRFRIGSPAKIVTIPLGLQLDTLLTLEPGAADDREELSIPRDDVVIGFVGRMVAIKSLPTLITSFAGIVQQQANVTLMLVGDGPLRREIEALALRLGVSSRVRFCGWREDLARVYATMDICALPSLNEGTPVALIEAMAAGRPVVATRVGGVPDVVDDGKTGLLVPAGDVESLTTAILGLARDAETRRRYGAAGREHVKLRYTVDRLIQDIEQLYASALVQKRRSPIERPASGALTGAAAGS